MQIETTTVIGTIVNPGTATVVVTSAYVSGSPVTLNVAVTAGSDAHQVAHEIRSDLSNNTAISSQFAISGVDADIVLTDKYDRANDTSLNISIANGTCTGLTAVSTSVDTQAGTGVRNGYADLTSFKTRYEINGVNLLRDTEINKILEACSRMIDKYTQRRFFTTANDETRVFTAPSYYGIFPDDIVSITSVKTDDDGDGTFETTWLTTDYLTFPSNVIPGESPITQLTANRWITRLFPLYKNAVQIIGKFGYCLAENLPSDIREACYIQSHRLYLRQSAPFGVVGSTEMGQIQTITKFDPDVKVLLDPYRRME